jgi:hypothetical protein
LLTDTTKSLLEDLQTSIALPVVLSVHACLLALLSVHTASRSALCILSTLQSHHAAWQHHLHCCGCMVILLAPLANSHTHGSIMRALPLGTMPQVKNFNQL